MTDRDLPYYKAAPALRDRIRSAIHAVPATRGRDRRTVAWSAALAAAVCIISVSSGQIGTRRRTDHLELAAVLDAMPSLDGLSNATLADLRLALSAHVPVMPDSCDLAVERARIALTIAPPRLHAGGHLVEDHTE